MIGIYTSMALVSLKRSKWRSLFTMLGVVIGVVSVVMIFALGTGLKKQVVGQFGDLSNDLIVVRSGKLITRGPSGVAESVNWSALFTQPTLSEKDMEEITSHTNVALAAPIAPITGSVTTSGGETLTEQSSIVATNSNLPEILDQEVAEGVFFTKDEENRNLIVIGSSIARKLFGTDPAVGRVLRINSTEFVIRGVMAPAPSVIIGTTTLNYNEAIYVPIGAARIMHGSTPLPIREISIQLRDGDLAGQSRQEIESALLRTHGGVEDFSVLTSRDFVGALDQVFSILTAFVASVAAISLFVGGIGIMNVMLVSVSERTREIGIRKSVGATNQQILGQFLIEAITLSFIGGVIGVLISLGLTGAFTLYSDLRPILEPRVIGVALLVAMGVGVFFGIVPALKAARKDPIESLR